MKKSCEGPWFSVCLNMEHTSCQERLQWYYEHDQPRVKAMQKKYEEYERLCDIFSLTLAFFYSTVIKSSSFKASLGITMSR